MAVTGGGMWMSVAATAGRCTVKVVPRPGALSTSIQPPAPDTKPYTMGRPRPVPFPGALVVKNGSKMRACVAGSMPLPVSITSSRAYLPAGWLGPVASTVRTRKISFPPCGMASRELMAKLRTISCNWPRPNRTCTEPPVSAVTSISCGSNRRRVLASSCTISARFATSRLAGSLRLNASR